MRDLFDLAMSADNVRRLKPASEPSALAQHRPMPTLDDIKRGARELRLRHGWPDKTPEQRVLYLASEVGELAIALQRLAAAQDRSDEAQDRLAEVAFERYDVVWNVCDLANILDIELDEAHNASRRSTETASGNGQGPHRETSHIEVQRQRPQHQPDQLQGHHQHRDPHTTKALTTAPDS